MDEEADFSGWRCIYVVQVQLKVKVDLNLGLCGGSSAYGRVSLLAGEPKVTVGIAFVCLGGTLHNS
jgi:hypothetical protein